MCAHMCGNLISGWTVHTAPAYTVPKNLPKVPREALSGSLGNSFSNWLQSKAGFSQSEDRGSGGPSGARFSHQGLISGPGYLKVWLCAGKTIPTGKTIVLGCLRAAQPV